jgi:hypothetical protein
MRKSVSARRFPPCSFVVVTNRRCPAVRTTNYEENVMPKYVFAYHGGGMSENEAEHAAAMEAWGAWFGALGEAIVDGGNPTGASKTVKADGSTSDGGGTNPITGYSLVNAADLESAVSLAKGCPILAAGGTVEVAEAIEM